MTTIGIFYRDLTPPEASYELGTSQSWKVHMMVRDLQEEISPGPPRGDEGGRNGSEERNNNTCRMDTRP